MNVITIGIGFMAMAIFVFGAAIHGYALAIYDTSNHRRELEDTLQLRAIEIARLKRQLQRAIAHQSIASEALKNQAPSTKNQEHQRQSGT